MNNINEMQRLLCQKQVCPGCDEKENCVQVNLRFFFIHLTTTITKNKQKKTNVYILWLYQVPNLWNGRTLFIISKFYALLTMQQLTVFSLIGTLFMVTIMYQFFAKQVVW